MSFKIDMILLCNFVINFSRLTHVFIYTCVFPAEGVPCGGRKKVSCTGRSALRQAMREPGNMWYHRTQVGRAPGGNKLQCAIWQTMKHTFTSLPIFAMLFTAMWFSRYLSPSLFLFLYYDTYVSPSCFSFVILLIARCPFCILSRCSSSLFVLVVP